MSPQLSLRPIGSLENKVSLSLAQMWLIIDKTEMQLVLMSSTNDVVYPSDDSEQRAPALK